MKIHQWNQNDGLGVSVIAGGDRSSTMPYHGHSTLWIPDTDYRGQTMHVCVSPRRQEAVIEDGRVVRACLGVEFCDGSPVLHVMVRPEGER